MRNKCEKKHKFFSYSQFWTILLQGFLSRIAGVQLRREGAPQWPVEWPQSLLCKSKPIFQQTFIIEMILIIELIMEWPKSTQATSAPKARGSRRFSTRRGWCQKIHQRFCFLIVFPGARPSFGQFWSRIALTRSLCSRAKAHPSHSCISC